MPSEFLLLSVGSNLGDRKKNIQNAFTDLSDKGILFDARLSSLYESEPVGYLDQPWFLNAAISGYTHLSAKEILSYCKNLELTLGRISRERWHERELDIDILLYGEHIIEIDDLKIPHPEMQSRKFVLLPSYEIAKDALHPIFHKTISELLENCNDNSDIFLLESDSDLNS